MAITEYPASGGVQRSGATTDGHLAVWNGSSVDSIKDGGAVPGGISGLTTNTLPKATSATTVGDSRIIDDGTSISIDSGAGTVLIGDVNDVTTNTTILIAPSTPVVEINVGATPWDFTETALFAGNPGLATVGTTASPLGSVYIGNDTNKSVQLTGTFTRNNAVIIQDKTQTLIGRAASVALTAQTASIGATNLQVNGGIPPAGLYRLVYYLVTDVAGTSGTLTATFGWTDSAAARTVTSATITFGTLSTPATGTVIIQADGIHNITYLTTVTTPVGSPQYGLNITVEALQ